MQAQVAPQQHCHQPTKSQAGKKKGKPVLCGDVGLPLGRKDVPENGDNLAVDGARGEHLRQKLGQRRHFRQAGAEGQLHQVACRMI